MASVARAASWCGCLRPRRRARAARLSRARPARRRRHRAQPRLHLRSGHTQLNKMVRFGAVASADSDASRRELRAAFERDLARLTWSNGSAAIVPAEPAPRHARRGADLIAQIQTEGAASPLLLDGEPLDGVVTVHRISGGHGASTDGVLIAAGPDIAAGAPSTASTSATWRRRSSTASMLRSRATSLDDRGRSSSPPTSGPATRARDRHLGNARARRGGAVGGGREAARGVAGAGVSRLTMRIA